eukprot:TRINITY_DN5831_c0_g1_i1.p1 TRINITY_DN5831_c0_g1~~TRINITY_DN5831_c0_g1_i1.p1  ORF type:complete len:150 (-),score=30.94 TRINITY_DN5831_c0_g1_i1:21-470(-)
MSWRRYGVPLALAVTRQRISGTMVTCIKRRQLRALRKQALLNGWEWEEPLENYSRSKADRPQKPKKGHKFQRPAFIASKERIRQQKLKELARAEKEFIKAKAKAKKERAKLVHQPKGFELLFPEHDKRRLRMREYMDTIVKARAQAGKK